MADGVGTSIKEFFTGKPGKSERLPILSPEQQSLQSQIIQRLGPLLQSQLGQKPIAPVSFEPIAGLAREKFTKETIPSLAERFTALGGGQRSSAFQGALGQAGSDLESRLAALRSQFGVQQQGLQLQQQGLQQNLLSSLLGLGLKSPFENIYQAPTQGALPGITQAAASILPYLLFLL